MRRRRRWIRKRYVLPALALVGVVWVGRQAYLSMTAVPGPQVDYSEKLRFVSESFQARGAPNAWPLVEEIAQIADEVRVEVMSDAALVQTNDVLAYDVLYDPAPYGRAQDTEARARLEVIARRGLAVLDERGVPALLDQLAAASRIVAPPPGPGPRPQVRDLRILARSQVARMWMAHRDGRGADVARAFEQGLAIGRALAMQGGPLDSMSGLAIHELIRSHLHDIALQGSLDEPALVACLKALQHQWLLPAELDVAGWRYDTLDTIQRVYTDDGRGSGRFIPVRARAFLMAKSGPLAWDLGPYANLTSVYFADRRTTVRLATEFFDGVAGLARLPVNGREGGFDADGYAAALGPQHPVLRHGFALALLSLWNAEVRAMREAGTHAALRVELHRARAGSHPQSLDRLEPADLPPPPNDPFSGRAFGYRRLDQPDEFGRRFLLWSVGSDGTDDGGRMNPEGNRRAVQRPRPVPHPDGFEWLDDGPFEPGFDYIINPPPEAEQGQ